MFMVSVNNITSIIINELTHNRPNQLKHIREIKLQPLPLDFENIHNILAPPKKAFFYNYPISRYKSFGIFPNCLCIAPNEPMT